MKNAGTKNFTDLGTLVAGISFNEQSCLNTNKCFCFLGNQFCNNAIV